jgi:hypothetical protein
MKPAPNVPGNTPWEKFDNAVAGIFKVSKEAFIKEEARVRRQRKRNRLRKLAN